MDVLGLEKLHPVRAAQNAAMSAAAAEKTKAAAEAPLQGDSVSVEGRTPPSAASASAEQLLGRLMEEGVVTGASRSIPSPEIPGGEYGSAALRLDLGDGEGAAEAQGELEEEWRPYLPPRAEQALSLPTDGRSLLLTLYGMPEGDGGLLDLGALSLPLNLDGMLLAQMLDGSYRLLGLGQEALSAMLQNGSARVESFTPPAAEQPRQSPGAEPEVPEPAPWAERLSLPAAPDAERPGGVAHWANAQAAARSFEDLTRRWLERSPDPMRPEAQTELRELRREWADTLRREDPAAFRALQSLEARPSVLRDGTVDAPQQTEGGAAEHKLSMPGDAHGVPEAAEEPGPTAQRWLRETFPRLLPREGGGGAEQNAAPQRIGYYAFGAAAPPKDEGNAMNRRLADYVQQLVSGRLRYSAGDTPLPQRQQEAETGAGGGELQGAWRRRQIGLEVDGDWAEQLRGWLDHVEGWRISRCRDYVNAHARAWAGALRDERPAGFRHWLCSPVRYAASTGWVNRATGSFPIETLPEGFTDEDFRRWMSFDVLDYL